MESNTFSEEKGLGVEALVIEKTADLEENQDPYANKVQMPRWLLYFFAIHCYSSVFTGIYIVFTKNQFAGKCTWKPSRDCFWKSEFDMEDFAEEIGREMIIPNLFPVYLITCAILSDVRRIPLFTSILSVNLFIMIVVIPLNFFSPSVEAHSCIEAQGKWWWQIAALVTPCFAIDSWLCFFLYQFFVIVGSGSWVKYVLRMKGEQCIKL